MGEIRGDRLDLDHDDDDRGTPTAGNYRGLAHSACNRRAGAAKAGRRLAAKGDRQRAYRRRVLGLPDLEEAEPVRELSPSRRRQVEAWRSPELAAANRVAAAQLGTTPEELARRWEGRQGGDAYLPLCWDAGPALRDEGAA